MELLDARRLTGPNLVSGRPGAIIDVACEEAEAAALVRCWEKHVNRMLPELEWNAAELRHHHLRGGLSLVLSAPIDALYTAAAIGEWAYACCDADMNGSGSPDFAQERQRIGEARDEEKNPALLALQAAAIDRRVPFLWDDDHVSLGHGSTAQTWDARNLPDIADVDWRSFRSIPVGLVTGTNGKTTTTRLARHIVGGAGKTVGLTSTDWIAAGETIVEHGDWSGPGGARRVLRHRSVDVALLETARGGLLRRGLGVERADAALITNIAEDHLGDFGSRNLDELLAIKWIVSQAVVDDGDLILNADDALLIAKAGDYPGRTVWFSLDANNPHIAAHVAGGGLAFVLRDDELVRIDAGEHTVLCRDREIPITLGGVARHNTANALAAAALCDRLGIGIGQIADGLRSMSQSDNPGRGNLYTLPHCRVLVDFAHNPHAMQALFDMAASLPAERRLLAFGQAGDRTDASIVELAERAWDIGLERVIVSELAAYRRGRSPGEVYGIIREALIESGARDEQISHCEQETDTLDAALAWARPGDLVIVLALGDSAGVRAKLDAMSTAGR